ncbi:MAG: flagellar export chaperone FliS [Janthinobacterium lividum]
MTSQTISLEYRRAATQQASVVGLVVALHDTLVGNLRRAADAIGNDDIQTRCNELTHGFKVLRQLDSMLDMKNGGETAVMVRRFYAYLRGQMLAAQFKLSAEILRTQIQSVLDVRQAWHQIDGTSSENSPQRVRPESAMLSHVERADRQELRVPFSCAG